MKFGGTIPEKATKNINQHLRYIFKGAFLHDLHKKVVKIENVFQQFQNC